jgi:hypothetical protein
MAPTLTVAILSNRKMVIAQDTTIKTDSCRAASPGIALFMWQIAGVSIFIINTLTLGVSN